MFAEDDLADLRRARFSPRASWLFLRRSLATARESAFQNPRLVRSIAIVGVVGFLVLLVVGVTTALLIDRGLGFRIFTGCGLLLLLGVALMAANIRLMVRPDGTPLARINPANILTLARLVAIPGLLELAAAGLWGTALVVYLCGGLTDVIDGWLARRHGDATEFGRDFDPVVDILFNAALFGALFRAGLIPGWVLGLVLTRYGLLLLGGIALAIFRGPIEIKPTILGKTTGVVTTILVVGLVGGRIFLPVAVNDRIIDLLVSAIGFVEAITIPQVIVIGWFNFRKAARPKRPPIHLVDLSPGAHEGRDRHFR